MRAARLAISMGTFVRVGKTGEVPPGHGRVVVVQGFPVALFNVEGRFYAVSNVCLHRGGPIGEGLLDETIVTCPNHGWEYDVRTGANLANPVARLRTFEVRVEGDDILVGT
jgi:nitrite reductase (NADH) small subunit